MYTIYTLQKYVNMPKRQYINIPICTEQTAYLKVTKSYMNFISPHTGSKQLLQYKIILKGNA